jgi:hypothetical protein
VYRCAAYPLYCTAKNRYTTGVAVNSEHSVGGKDYPRTLPEFQRFFPGEDACRLYAMRVRWPDLAAFSCPQCGTVGTPWMTGDQLLKCRDCKARTSVTAGTIFDGTRKPLSLWFLAMWTVMSQKTGASALGVQRVLGLTRYETAWLWLHKLRRAMVRPGRERLTGTVQVDEAMVGGVSHGADGRGSSNAIVLIAAEGNGRKIGRIRLAVVERATTIELAAFLSSSVEPGSTAH